MAQHPVTVQHDIENNVVKWIIQDPKWATPNHGIVVLIDLDMPEEAINSIFEIAHSMDVILADASQALRKKIVGS